MLANTVSQHPSELTIIVSRSDRMTFTLSGKVTDAVSGAGIGNALVKIISGSGSNFGKSATTDPTGHYSIAGLSPGTVIVEAFLAGYVPSDKMLTITANATENFSLHTSTYALKGKVTDATTGAPVQDALVKIVSGSGSNFGKSATTDSSGRYSIVGLNPGTVIVEAYLAYVPNDKMLTITANTTENFSLTK
jgi:uncharacterized surface anchored protein